MRNDLNEKSTNAVILAAIISALVVLVAGLTAALVLAVQNYRHRIEPRTTEPPKQTEQTEQPEQPNISKFIIVDAAVGLKNSASALRLCNHKDSAVETVKNGLMYATRAETALECDGGDYSAKMAKEAFLNDASALLSRPDPMHAVEKADELYHYSAMFYDSVLNGNEFTYNGELGEVKTLDTREGMSAEEAAELVKRVLGIEATHTGSYENAHNFSVDHGYVTVTGDKISEFSFFGESGDADPNAAQEIALNTARACGYDDLYVYGIERSEKGLAVKMCCACCGALCRDECAVAVVAGDKAIAFSAGKCGTKHELPKAVYTEEQARINAPEGGEGRLVTLHDGERDRICYEYRYELDDGEHFVYVCAQNGRQMGLR